MVTSRSEKISITLIDDNAIFRTIFCHMLDCFPGYPLEINTYNNALEFLEQTKALQKKTIDSDFLFVDINMPFMTGWELMDKFSTASFHFASKTAVYIISSSASNSDREQIKNYPFITGYVLKPVNKSELIQIIQQHLTLHGH